MRGERPRSRQSHRSPHGAERLAAQRQPSASRRGRRSRLRELPMGLPRRGVHRPLDRGGVVGPVDRPHLPGAAAGLTIAPTAGAQSRIRAPRQSEQAQRPASIVAVARPRSQVVGRQPEFQPNCCQTVVKMEGDRSPQSVRLQMCGSSASDAPDMVPAHGIEP